jgi:formate/nitrite transporter FocA (FNT family)
MGGKRELLTVKMLRFRRWQNKISIAAAWGLWLICGDLCGAVVVALSVSYYTIVKEQWFELALRVQLLPLGGRHSRLK